MNACLFALCLALGPRAEPQQPDRFFAEDKLKHFFTSFLVTSLAASGARAAGLDSRASLWVGAGTGAVVGVGKELRDRGGEGATASALDIVWDAAGVGAGIAVAAQAN